MHPITAAMLYDWTQCPHRPYVDLFTNRAKRDETSPFMKLLWEKGTAYERMAGVQKPLCDLSYYMTKRSEKLLKPYSIKCR